MPRVLVYETSTPDAVPLVRLLSDAGWVAEAALTLADIRQRLQSGAFDLLAIDGSAPGDGVIRLCRWARQGTELPAVPIAWFYTRGVTEQLQRGLAAGADVFVPRDETPQQIALRLEALVQPQLRRPEEQTSGPALRIPGTEGSWDLAADRAALWELLQEAWRELDRQRHAEGHLAQQLAEATVRREKVERDLRESEAVYHSLVENVPVSLLRKDLQGRFTFANGLFLRELGCTLDELIGKTDFDFFPPSQAEKYRADDQRVIQTGRVFEDVEEHTTPQGETRYVHVLKAPVLDASGQIAGVQAVFWDVTDRKRSEMELRESEACKQAIFDASLDSMIITDAQRRIVDLNRAAERTLGYRREEVLGREIDQLLFGPSTAQRARRNVEQYLATGETGSLLGKRVEVPLVRKDGEPFIGELAMQPVALGRTFALLTVLRDITQRKRAEAELRQAKQAAENANRAKSAFLANMSHEIRTPMNAIIGMTELVLGTELTPEQREYLEIVLDSAESLLSLINDILDLSKIEAGKLELDEIPFDLREKIDDTLRALAPRAHAKGLELAWHVEPQVPAVLVGDPGRLRQILNNLLGNAIKFTEAGEVVLLVELVSQRRDAVLLQFTVRDTGIGIPADKLDRIFGAFEQVDTSTTRRYGGTGLGLTISSKLVKLMKGKLWAESKPGVGSTFQFTARFQRSSQTPAMPPRAALPGLREASVLVVDDNATNRRILQKMLSNWGLHVELAESAAEGLALYRAARDAGTPFALVLSDVHMPGMDGFQMVQSLQRDQVPAESVILMLSSSDRSGDTARCRQLGIAHYLSKPISQSDLWNAIASALAPQAAPQPAQVPAARTSASPQGSLRVLLAEDSSTNQKLAVSLLQREGHRVTVVSNGLQAVEAVRREPFDVVLMDLQMPEMDGLEATQQIRAWEASTGGHIPIVAMTAHAMKGDREQCLAAGMDAYLAKPVRADELVAALQRVCEGGAGLGAADVPVSTGPPDREAASSSTALPDGERLDWNAALRTVQGDRELLAEVVQAMLTEIPERLAELRSAIEAADAATVRRAAHTIRGALRTFEARHVSRLAEQIETKGRSGDLNDLEELVVQLERRLQAVLRQLHEFARHDDVLG